METIRGIAVLSCLMIAGAAHADCLKGNAGLPPGANTTDPSAPFYIDTTGLDFKTLPPTRDPRNPNYPQATELPDGTLPPVKAEGNFIIGPTHSPAPELTAQDGAPKGKIYSFTMSSNDSTVFNPGMIRDDPDGCLNASVYTGQTAPGDKSNLLVPTAHAGIWTRSVDVYVPPGYVAGSEAPFIVVGDSGYPVGKQFFTVLDNLIHERRVPPTRRNLDRRRRAGRAGKRTGIRVRRGQWRLCGIRRERSAAAGRENTRISSSRKIRKAARRWASARADRRRSRWRGSTPNSIIAC